MREYGAAWCRRVVAAEDVTALPRSQSDVPSKMVYGNLSVTAPAWRAEAAEIMPGVHVARVMIEDDEVSPQVRIIN